MTRSADVATRCGIGSQGVESWPRVMMKRSRRGREAPSQLGFSFASPTSMAAAPPDFAMASPQSSLHGGGGFAVSPQSSVHAGESFGLPTWRSLVHAATSPTGNSAMLRLNSNMFEYFVFAFVMAACKHLVVDDK